MASAPAAVRGLHSWTSMKPIRRTRWDNRLWLDGRCATGSLHPRISLRRSHCCLNHAAVSSLNLISTFRSRSYEVFNVLPAHVAVIRHCLAESEPTASRAPRSAPIRDKVLFRHLHSSALETRLLVLSLWAFESLPRGVDNRGPCSPLQSSSRIPRGADNGQSKR